MKIKFSLFFLSMVLFPIVVIAANSIKYQDKATEDAANLVTQYTLADDAQKQGYLKKLEALTVKHPDNNNVRKMYANILIADKKYPSGLEQMEMLNKNNPQPVSKLTECMLVERNGKDAESCYKNAVALFETNRITDDNYVMALYLADDPRFEAEKKKLISSGKLTETEKSLFSMSKNELISTMFP